MKNIKFLTTICYLLTIGTTFMNAQQWEKVFSTSSLDMGRTTLQTSDGGFITTGYSSGFTGNGDVLLLKTDGNGTFEWSIPFGAVETKQDAYDMTICANGDFAIVGYSHSYPYDKDVYIIRTDSVGNLLWSQEYNDMGNEVGHSIIEANNGDLVILGNDETTGEVFLKRMDSVGNVLWTIIGAGIGHEVIELENGDLACVITMQTNTTGDDISIAKITANGTLIWNVNVGGTAQDSGHGIVEVNGGELVITGYSESGPADYLKDVFLTKLDSNGVTLWAKTFGASNKPDVGNSVKVADDGGLIIAGRTASMGDTWGDAYLLKTDADGNMEWEKKFGADINNKDEAYSVSVNEDGGYILTGETNSFTDSKDLYLIRTNDLGETILPTQRGIVAIEDLLGLLSTIYVTVYGKTNESEVLLLTDLYQYENVKIQLYDLQGRCIDTRPYNEQTWMYYKDSFFSNIYVYQIFNGNELLKSGKVSIY